MQQDNPSILNQATEWIQEQGKSIGLFLAMILLAAIFLTTYTNKKKTEKSHHLLLASHLAEQMHGTQREKAREELEQLVKNHSYLQPIYQAKIAQSALQSVWATGKPAPKITKNLQDPSYTLFMAYSQTTYLIAEKQYEKALKQTEEQLSLVTPQTPQLKLFILLRLASLHYELNQYQQAGQAWQQLLQLQDSNPEEFKKFSSLFSQEKMELKHFPLYQIH